MFRLVYFGSVIDPSRSFPQISVLVCLYSSSWLTAATAATSHNHATHHFSATTPAAKATTEDRPQIHQDFRVKALDIGFWGLGFRMILTLLTVRHYELNMEASRSTLSLNKSKL